MRNNACGWSHQPVNGAYSQGTRDHPAGSRRGRVTLGPREVERHVGFSQPLQTLALQPALEVLSLRGHRPAAGGRKSVPELGVEALEPGLCDSVVVTRADELDHLIDEPEPVDDLSLADCLLPEAHSWTARVSVTPARNATSRTPSRALSSVTMAAGTSRMESS